jgi:hypothetical protein
VRVVRLPGIRMCKNRLVEADEFALASKNSASESDEVSQLVRPSVPARAQLASGLVSIFGCRWRYWDGNNVEA